MWERVLATAKILGDRTGRPEMTEVAGQLGPKTAKNTLEALACAQISREFEINILEIRVHPRESAEEKFWPLR